MGDVERLGDAPGVVDVLDTATLGAAAESLGTRLGPEPHRDADDLMALFLEQRGGDGGVDTAAHRDDDALARAHRAPRVVAMLTQERGAKATLEERSPSAL